MRQPSTPAGASPAAQFYRALIAMCCGWCEICGHYHLPGGAHISLGIVRTESRTSRQAAPVPDGDEPDDDHELVVSDELRAILDTVDDGEVPA
jgi:hypothetical protein